MPIGVQAGCWSRDYIAQPSSMKRLKVVGSGRPEKRPRLMQFLGRLEHGDGARCVASARAVQKTALHLSVGPLLAIGSRIVDSNYCWVEYICHFLLYYSC